MLTYSCSANLKGKKVKWTSSNRGIVTVKNGKLIAKNKGTAIITVRIGSYSRFTSSELVDLYFWNK